MQIRKLIQLGAALSIAIGAVGVAARSAHAVSCPWTAHSWDLYNDFHGGYACCTSSNGTTGCAHGFDDSAGEAAIQAWGSGNAPPASCGGTALWAGKGINPAGVTICLALSSGSTVQESCPSTAADVRIEEYCIR